MPINLTVAWLTLRQMFANRRLLLALAIALVPTLLTLIFTWVSSEAAAGGATGFFVVMQREIVLGTLLPISALVFGTTAFGGELEDGTLIYLLVKPVPRWQVVVSKYVVATLATVMVMVPAVALPWVVVQGSDMPFAVVRALVTGAVVGSAIYASFFMFLGLVTKRALMAGLIYVIGFESVLSRSGAAGAKALSVREFAVSVAQSTGDAAVMLGSAGVSMTTVRNVGGVMFASALLLTIWRLRRYQLAERAS